MLQVADPISETLVKTLSLIAEEIIFAIPGIIATVIVLGLLLLIIRIMNPILYKLAKLVNLDNITKQLFGFSLPFAISKLVVYMADIGVVLTTILVLVNILFGFEAAQLTVEGLSYLARLVSVIAITFFILGTFNVALDRLQSQSKLKGYTLFIIILIVTAMLIDITALTESAKASLMGGLSIGIGISVGVFAVWFFFNDFIERSLKKKE